MSATTAVLTVFECEGSMHAETAEPVALVLAHICDLHRRPHSRTNHNGGAGGRRRWRLHGMYLPFRDRSRRSIDFESVFRPTVQQQMHDEPTHMITVLLNVRAYINE